MYQKSQCNEEGQIVYSNVSAIEDRNCTCDYSAGYVFLREPAGKCFCSPSVEDCSCYKKTCTDQSLLNKGIFCYVIWLCTLFCFEQIFFLAGIVWPCGLLSSHSIHLHSSSLKLQGRIEANFAGMFFWWTSSESVILVSIWNSIIHPELIMTFHWLTQSSGTTYIFAFFHESECRLSQSHSFHEYIVISWVVK